MNVTPAQLSAAADDLNQLMNLDPALPCDAADNLLREKLCAAAVLLEPSDRGRLQPETVRVLRALGVSLPWLPTSARPADPSWN